MRITNLFRLGIILSITLLLTAFGFSLRNNSHWPPAFHTVNLDMPSLNTNFSSRIEQLIRGMNSTITQHDTNAYSIVIQNIQFYHNQPPITTSNQAITFTFTFAVTLSIKDPKLKTLYGPILLTTTQPMIVNSNQIYSNTAESIVRPMLEQRMVSLIYDHLTSETLAAKLSH